MKRERTFLERALRKVFRTTPMAHYGDSPGTIYPALRRLERAGLIERRRDRRAALRPKGRSTGSGPAAKRC